MKRAVITGINGQDGSHLADILLGGGYQVWGITRRRSSPRMENVEGFIDNPNFQLCYGDITDSGSITRVLKEAQPQEFYNLAAQSFVGLSWKEPTHTFDVTGRGVLVCLEAIREVDPSIRFYQASSSEMFGKVKEMPQREETPFHPRSPYGVAKVAGYWMTRNYRESFGMHATNGILFNHEGTRRGPEFVTRKITKAAARISLGLQDSLGLGNLESRRDWGDARDYMRAAHMMLQQDESDDYVVATGKDHSIKDFLEHAFGYLGLDWQDYVYVDPEFFRPAEVDILLGDSSKAKRVLGWEPQISFGQMVEEMVENDLRIEAAAR